MFSYIYFNNVIEIFTQCFKGEISDLVNEVILESKSFTAGIWKK